jgi:hypothetical protein
MGYIFFARVELQRLEARVWITAIRLAIEIRHLTISKDQLYSLHYQFLSMLVVDYLPNHWE